MLKIEADRITYWESDGPIKAVVVRGKYEIALIAELSGEGETRLSTAHFKLSPEKNMLIDMSDPEIEFIRYRCPLGE